MLTQATLHQEGGGDGGAGDDGGGEPGGGRAAKGYADGEGGTARFNTPFDVAVDGNNAILVADYFNHRVRMIAGRVRG